MEAPVDYEKAAAVTVTVSKSATTTIFVYNPILYDFSVDVNVPSNAGQFEPFLINTEFRNKGGKAAINVPVKISFEGTILYDTAVSIPAGGSLTKIISTSSDILGNKTILASINESKTKRESYSLDNTDSAFITIDAATNLKIEFITPNMDYREGTTVISTFRVRNIGSVHMTPSSNLSVGLNISYIQLSLTKSIIVPNATQIIIPFGGDNLVFFKWTVPLGTAGVQFKFIATIDPTNSIAETAESDNIIILFRTITEKKSSQTPDTIYEDKKPSWYNSTTPPSRISCNAYTWAIWEWENSWFVRKSYALQLASNVPSIVPDINSPSRKIEFGIWSMGSGYGFTLDWNIGLQSIPGFIFPNSTAYTLPQTASIYLPEFMYDTSNGKCRALENIGSGRFSLPINPNSKNNTRLHFTPIWFPDGSYICQGLAEDIWTPSGMIYGNFNSNEIKISGSIYDDWYVKGR